jgi:O-antigen/teichoic acid export membrane protein
MDNNSSSEKNRIILKNTLFMYGRMLVMLFISLFTARVVFNTLGVDDYGTYNLVAGIIVFFTFLNNGLGIATKRYITAEIAKGDERSISHVFYICILAHLIIASIILVLAETVGLWGVNYILNIPSGRMYAANWVYQLSVISAVLGIVQSPFGSVIVAYEKMNIYAYFTIFDAVAKLFIIYMVQAVGGDKLIIYAFLVFGVSIANMLLYRIYTYRTFPVCRLNERKRDKPLLKEIFSFMSWSLAGQAAVVGTNQGVSVLVNIYYNVAVNAAMGVSNSITNIINGFITNFQVAFNPQIVKSYVSKDFSYLQNLIVRSSKLSSFLVIIFLVPLMFEAGNVLKIWLGDYPEYSVEFCILTLLAIYFEAVSAPLWMTVYAQKDIKSYQIVISTVYSLNFFVGWLVLFLGAAPYSVITVRVIVFIALAGIRLYFTKKFFTQFDVKRWIEDVLWKGILIFFISSILTGGIMFFIECHIFIHIILTTLISLCFTLPMIYFLGLKLNERNFIKQKAFGLFHKSR